MKVLVVDDNKNMTNIVRIMMEKKNHRVKTANDGENGYSAYIQFKPDLVVTDIQMPGENGFDLMTKIRSHNPLILTIYMTGDPGRFLSRLKEEQSRHPVDFLCKPFSISDLSMKLSKFQACG
jgi:DNA-binding response OmpR family regulator